MTPFVEKATLSWLLERDEANPGVRFFMSVAVSSMAMPRMNYAGLRPISEFP